MMTMRKRRKVMRQKMNKDSCIIQTVNLVVGHLDTVIVMMDGITVNSAQQHCTFLSCSSLSNIEKLHEKGNYVIRLPNFLTLTFAAPL